MQAHVGPVCVAPRAAALGARCRGYNYDLNNHPEDHKRVPSGIMVATESFVRSTFDYRTMVE